MRICPSLAAAAILALAGRDARAEDTRAAIDAARAVYVACDEGWRTGNVQEILDTYAPNFEWTNSVGVRITDKARLRSFIEHVFKEADYRAGHPGPLKIISMRKLGDDVVVISSAESTFGQKDYRTGKVVPEQRSNELTVLQRLGGRWLIVSDLTSDESHGI
jgi:uncharacterized protein (TIGR02246 family)